MTVVPTPELSARNILKVLIGRFGLRAGSTLKVHQFLWLCMDKYSMTDDQVSAGLKHAVGNDWLQVDRAKDAFMLTPRGYTEITR